MATRLQSLDFYQQAMKPHHKRAYMKIGEKIRKKVRALVGSLKRRGKEHGIETLVEAPELGELLLKSYKTPCRYCGRVLIRQNMACDHIHPISKGGLNEIGNLQFICKSCNTRKGPMDAKEWEMFNEFVRSLSEGSASYVLRQMAKGGAW